MHASIHSELLYVTQITNDIAIAIVTQHNCECRALRTIEPACAGYSLNNEKKLNLTELGSKHEEHNTILMYGCHDNNPVCVQISILVLVPSCQQLMNELLQDSVACRYARFGVQLGLSPDTIECITMNHRDVYRCLINVINHWVNNFQVSWNVVVKALDRIDCKIMAETICQKYNVVVVS